ncbi:DUF3379 family protein [Thiomicrorhabdus sediminis]|uniref:DUF3379 domain-containing protein n=1 Tax=Thiomicrorhabdus sediminis TaxID=2580412 RepID=A0A4P9K6W4_9GAMM|nr:DUF3379 family protein [Thiomicrorhabdus sediminis]QCU90805.1 DUF3379 domain-containing protein [Thiomicrorhabdus sediminis]
MNDIRFQTQIMINPYQLDEELLCYLQANPEKKAVLKKARELDQDISQALDIEVPEGLHARILLNQSYQQFIPTDHEPDLTPLAAKHSPTSLTNEQSDTAIEIADKRLNWTAMAMVASLFLVSVLLIFNPMTPANLQGSQVVHHILAHIKEDPSLMANKRLPQSEAELQQLFASVNASLHQPLDGMSYAGICDVEGRKGLHLVVQQFDEPVTIIVLPGAVMESLQAFESSGMHGELIPIKGGLVAIVGNNLQQVAMAQMAFFKAVQFV